MKIISVKACVLSGGIILLGISSLVSQANSRINNPSPSFTEEGLSWGGSPVINQNWLASEESELLNFHMMHASKDTKPEFCISTPLADSFLDLVTRDKCYFRENDYKGKAIFSVTDCVYNSEWVDLRYERPVECNKVVTKEVMDQYKAGKASRYYGYKPLLAAEQEVEDMKSLLADIWMWTTLPGLLLCSAGGVALLFELPKRFKNLFRH